jgi:hypothetical protein
MMQAQARKLLRIEWTTCRNLTAIAFLEMLYPEDWNPKSMRPTGSFDASASQQEALFPKTPSLDRLFFAALRPGLLYLLA